MNALIEIPRARFLSWDDAPRTTLDADSYIVSRDAQPKLIAAVRSHNPMHDPLGAVLNGEGPEGVKSSTRIATWSGSLAEDLNDDEPLNFMRRGHEAFHARCTELHDALIAAGRRLAFIPHHRHLLSDTPSVRAFLDQWAGGPFDIILDPALLFAESMFDRAEEHAERMFELIAPRAIAWRLPLPRRVPAEVGAAIEAAGRQFDPDLNTAIEVCTGS
ncbi:MAG: hypothetical protein KC983_08495 [Phycisphaerales bacterium]|nr:hypothetical protein [Phycisphaerales bacterium]